MKKLNTLLISSFVGDEATVEVLKDIISNSNSKMMVVEFVKKDNSIRTMYAKTGVKKFLSKKPNKRKVVKKENTINVYDAEAKAYRSFNLDSVIKLSVGNVVWCL